MNICPVTNKECDHLHYDDYGPQTTGPIPICYKLLMPTEIIDKEKCPKINTMDNK
jgi:hypothetical protein